MHESEKVTFGSVSSQKRPWLGLESEELKEFIPIGVFVQA